MIGIFLDILLGYFGINSLIGFSYLFIYKKNYLDIIIIGLIMDLFYVKYYCTYLIIWYFIIKLIYKYVKKNIFTDLLILYFVVLIYYLITINIMNYKIIVLYSFIPCIFYLLVHIIKYEKDKQNISSNNNYTRYSYRYKNKSQV